MRAARAARLRLARPPAASSLLICLCLPRLPRRIKFHSARPALPGIGVPAAAASGMMAANSLASVFDHLGALNELAL